MAYFAAQRSAVCAMKRPHIGSSSASYKRVFELALPELEAAAQAAHDVRRLAHALHAAGEDDLGFAELDVLRAGDRRLDAGAAQPVHRQRRHTDRQPGLERDMARAVDGIGARLQHVAEDHVIDPARLDARPLERAVGGNGAELERRDVAQRPRVLHHGRPRARRE